MREGRRGAPAGSHDISGLGDFQVVHSPEHVLLQLPIAGPTSRMLAYAIDFAAIVLIQIGLFAFALLLLLGGAAWVHGKDLLVFIALWLLAQFVLEWAYFVVTETFMEGQSLGKRALHLRVVGDGGGPLTLRDSFVRNFLRMADVLPGGYLVGLVTMVASGDGKRLGDLAAGTLVVRLDRAEAAAPIDEEDAGALAGFRFTREHIARIGPVEIALLTQTLRRANAVEDPRRASELRARAVEALRARLGYEAVEPTEHEAFLRALVRATRQR